MNGRTFLKCLYFLKRSYSMQLIFAFIPVTLFITSIPAYSHLQCSGGLEAFIWKFRGIWKEAHFFTENIVLFH